MSDVKTKKVSENFLKELCPIYRANDSTSASATEMVKLASISGRVKPKILKIDMYRFPARRSPMRGTV